MLRRTPLKYLPGTCPMVHIYQKIHTPYLSDGSFEDYRQQLYMHYAARRDEGQTSPIQLSTDITVVDG
jgi:hypothetical protein